MASLVLGVAVGALGQMVGIPFGVGFMVGSMAGSLLFAQKNEVPKLTDRKLQTAAYGIDISIVYGMVRLSGICDWQTKLEDHEHGGGKGSSEPASVSYSASFSMLLCKNEIVGVNRRWAAGRLLTEEGDDSNWPFVLYRGTATQLPDPTIEANVGAGKVTGNRGKAYEVVTDKDMSEFGNALPLMDYEVFTNAGPIPNRISTFQPWDAVSGVNPTTYGATYADGVITCTSFNVAFASDVYYVSKFNRDGTQIGTTTNEIPFGGYHHNIRNLNAYEGSPDATNFYWYQLDAAGVAQQGAAIAIPGAAGGNANVYMNGSLYTVAGVSGGVQTIGRFTAINGIPGEFVDFVGLDDNYTADGVYLGTSDTGDIYVLVGIGGACKMWKFTWDLTLVHFWDVADTSGTNLSGNWNFVVHENLVCFDYATGANHFVGLVKIDPDTLTLLDYGVPLLHSSSFISCLRGCLMIDRDGTFSLCPPPAPVILGNIVADQCRRAGYLDAQYNPAALPVALPDLVDGCMAATQMTHVAFINMLRRAYFFDGFEQDGVMVFVKRGGAAEFDIPDDELCAHEYGSEPPAPFHIVRTPPSELPRRVDVKYIDKDLDYQQGSQGAVRQVTDSTSDITVELAIVMTATKARAIATTLLYEAHIEKEKLVFFTWRKWSKVMPSNVGTVHGYTVRITNKIEFPNGKIQFEAVPTLDSIYAQPAPGAPSEGFEPQEPPGAAGRTNLELFALPMATDSAFPRGFYVAGSRAVLTGTWPGYALYKSVDGGANYAVIASTATRSIMGTTSDALPNFSGVRIFDELSTVTVMVGPGGGELESVTAILALAGQNMFAIGSEWVIAKNVVQTSSDTYRLSGLLRGLRGTEWAIGTHVAGERWALASTMLNVDCPEPQLFQTHLYKAVTFGQTLAAATPVSFANMAVGARCYAPVYLRGGPNASGDIIAECTRRTRTGGEWLNGVDAALGELTEEYVAQVWDATYTTCVRVIPALPAPTCTVTAAQQVADFGATQAGLFMSFGQVGAYGLGVQVRAFIPGAGASIDAPLVSTPPYGGNPSAPPSGGGGTVNAVLTWPSDESTTTNYKVGDTWVWQFTTGGGTPGGRISVSEFGDPATTRLGRLCTSANGSGELARQYGNTVTFLFNAGVTVAASTTYYLIVTCDSGPGLPNRPLGESANMQCDLVGS